MPTSAVASLLPPVSTPLERALEATPEARLRAIGIPLRALWRPAEIPAPLLPWLAWAFHLDDWRDDWSEERQRAAIAESIELHRIKGTPGAVKRALERRGYRNVELLEFGTIRYDGEYRFDGAIAYQEAFPAYRFSVRLDAPHGQVFSDADIAELIPVIDAYKNVRSKTHLWQAYTLHYDAEITYDGTHHHDGRLQWQT